jgi:hypothetical protein
MRPSLRVFACLLLFPALGLGQTPDRRGEVALLDPVYRGVRASAPIPVELHVRNEGGSNGAGLCVISSVLSAGMSQGIPGLDRPGHDEATGGEKPGKGSQLWRTAKSRPGGYSPDKLASLLNQIMPDQKWVSYVGTDPTEIEKLTKAGYRVCATMNTGQQYSYRPIHHMINVIHYETNGWACVVDNNDPGKFHWMPAAEYARRSIDGGTLWAFAWLYKVIAGVSSTSALILIASAVMLAAGAVVFLIISRGRDHVELHPLGDSAVWAGR